MVEFDTSDLDRLFALFENPPESQWGDRDKNDFAHDILLKMMRYMGQNGFDENMRNEWAEHVIKLVSQFEYKIPYSFSEYIRKPHTFDEGYAKKNITPVSVENLDNESRLYGFYVGLVMLTQFYDEDSEDFYKQLNLLCETCEIDFDKLSKIDLVNLNCMYDISNKYSITQIKSFRLLIEELDSKNPDKIDKTKFMISFFRDAIFHSEIIILSYYYKQWFGEVYQADVSGWESYDSWRYINDEDSQLNQKNPSNMADKPEPTKVA